MLTLNYMFSVYIYAYCVFFKGGDFAMTSNYIQSATSILSCSIEYELRVLPVVLRTLLYFVKKKNIIS